MSDSTQSGQKVLSLEIEGESLTEKKIAEVRTGIEPLNAHDLLVVDCSHVNQAEPGAVAALGDLARDVAGGGVGFALMANKEMVGLLRQTELPRFARSVIEVNRIRLVSQGGREEDVFQDLVNAFTASTVLTLENFTGSRPDKLEPGEFSQGVRASSMELAGVLEFEWGSRSGRLGLSFPLVTYLKFTSCIMGQEYKELQPEIMDWSAELLNMISATARESLNNNGYQVTLALPETVKPVDLLSLRSQSLIRTVVPFRWQGEPFWLEVLAPGRSGS